jgi:hypothetical protein
MKASEIRLENTQISFLFKSPFGFGKTLAAASFALAGPVYLSYWDKKSPVELVTFFKRFGQIGEQILDNIIYDVYGSENANEYLNKLIDLVQDCRYTAIINDSVTFMTASAVHWSQNFGKDPKIKKKIKDIIPDWDEYKVETNLISQCIDISRKLPCHIIWTAHPMPTTKIEGSGNTMRVTKVNPIVSYGQKVAGMIPGSFTEIYHFSQKVDWNADGKSSKRYIVHTEATGDEFAKSPLLGNYVKEFDITDQLFYQVWIDLVNKSRVIEPKPTETTTETAKLANPFNKSVAGEASSKWRT